jgi:hypothetical protein
MVLRIHAPDHRDSDSAAGASPSRLCRLYRHSQSVLRALGVGLGQGVLVLAGLDPQPQWGLLRCARGGGAVMLRWPVTGGCSDVGPVSDIFIWRDATPLFTMTYVINHRRS